MLGLTGFVLYDDLLGIQMEQMVNTQLVDGISSWGSVQLLHLQYIKQTKLLAHSWSTFPQNKVLPLLYWPQLSDRFKVVFSTLLVILTCILLFTVWTASPADG